MFYNHQTEDAKNNYKKMLTIIGGMTKLFNDDEIPYLHYRCQENIFCKYFDAINLARHDCSADAKKGNIGIGLKTWRGQNDQKVAEFGKLREAYKNKAGLELVKTIASYRNKRIEVTKNMYAIEILIYHIVKRDEKSMQILECAFDEIDIDNIRIIENRGNDNNIYFSDKKHTYHFSLSKNTLYMIFDETKELDSFDVKIMEDPYNFLLKIYDNGKSSITSAIPKREALPADSICLRLYSIIGGRKVVNEKSGLNQWNAEGRNRDPNEIYIPYPSIDRRRNPDFFPPRDVPFNLELPDGKIISAKLCQGDSKAIMSNPNKALGEWLLRKVFRLPEGTLVTYEMLEVFDIDSVIFTKKADKYYSIDFAKTGTYEECYADAYADISDAEE